MKIEFEFDESGQVKLLKSIPDHKRLKLLGYNGIGKTLTANVLATISGQSPWKNKEEVRSLGKFLPQFIAKISIGNQTYKIEANVTEWKMDPLTNVVHPDSLGKITLNGKEISADEFQNEFNCSIVRGNEDIKTQISLMAHNLQRAIIFNLSQIEDKTKSFSALYETLYEALEQDGLFNSIRELEKDVSNNQAREVDSNLIDVIDEFLLSIKKAPSLDWFSSEGPLATFEKMETLAKEIRDKLYDYEQKIETLRRNIPPRNKDKLAEFRKKIEEFENRINSIKFPLELEEYSSQKATKDARIATQRKKEEITNKVLVYKEHQFRSRYLPTVLQHLKIRLSEDKLPIETKIFLKAGGRAPIDIDGLEHWYLQSIKLGQKALEGLEEFHDLNQKLLELDEMKRKLEEHETKLKERQELEKKLRSCKAQYQNLCNELSDLEKLPQLESDFLSLESDLKIYNSAKNSLKHLSSHENWDTVFGQEFDSSDPKKFVSMLSEFSESVKDIKRQRKQLDENKKKYLKVLKKKLSNETIPNSIQSLIDNGDVITLCKICSVLYTGTGNVIEFLKDECRGAIRSILDKDEKSEDEKGEDQGNFIKEANLYLGTKIKDLLNREAFKQHVFGGSEVISVDPQKGLLVYRNKEEDEYEKFIGDYSTGQKAFAFSMASILYAMESRAKNNLLILDEFGAMLAIDKELYLYKHLDTLQDKSNWPSQYIVVLPYKGEFRREDYKKSLGAEAIQLQKDVERGKGYAFIKL